MKITFAQIEKTLEFLRYADFITEEQIAEADMMKIVALVERFKKDVDTTFNSEKDAVEEFKIGDIYKHNSKEYCVKINGDAYSHRHNHLSVTVTALTKDAMRQRYTPYEGNKYVFTKGWFAESWTKVEHK